MRKRMLLAAVGDYQGFAQTLVAPVQELDRWERLLMGGPYGLVPIGPSLKDATATRQNILNGLAELFSGAGDGDQLVFVFCGHGSNVEVARAGGSIDREQVLIAYPNGDSNLRNAMIRYSDVLGLIEKFKPHEHADITLVFESCFSAGVAGPDFTPMFVSLEPAAEGALRLISAEAERVRAGGKPIRAFADLAALSGAGAPRVAVPSGAVLGFEAIGAPAVRDKRVVIVAASRRDQAAYEHREAENTYRLVFSRRAIPRLSQNQDTFDDLPRNINPLFAGHDQHAEVIGDPERTAEPFPGRSTVSETSLTDKELLAQSIRMRILGLGCFIQGQTTSPFLNRIVLPRDTVGTGDQRHFGFIEIPEADIVTYTGTFLPITYLRAGIPYKRWELTNHRVWLFNPDVASPFTRSPLFQTHVPLMTDVCPDLTPSPRSDCYETFPNPAWFTGFIDFGRGHADIGPLENTRTRFTREFGGTPTPWGPEYTPLSVTVDMYYTGDQPILLIADVGNVSTMQLFIKPGATILAGNAREADITGTGAGDTPREHFRIFYSLADPKPANLALPAQVFAPINACSSVRWP